MSTQPMSTQLKAPTDRRVKSNTDKSTKSLAQRVRKSSLLKPVKMCADMASRRVFFKALSYLQHGSITLIETFGKNAKKQKMHTFGDTVPKTMCDNKQGEVAGTHSLHVTLRIHNKTFYRQLITGGERFYYGFAKSHEASACLRLHPVYYHTSF